MTRYFLDPDATLDYAFDWTPWLATGETITAHTVSATSGVTIDSSSVAGGIVTVWLSAAVANTRPVVTCHITTSAGRQDDRSFDLYVTER